MHPLGPNSFFKYPKTEKVTFSSKWYQDFSWLKYSVVKNAAFFFNCRHFGENNSNFEDKYTKKGFRNFSKGPEKFRNHQKSKTHKTSTLLYLNRISEKDSVAQQLDSHHKSNVEENRSYLTVIEMKPWLCKQGLSLGGHDETEDSKNQGNFLELVKFHSNYSLDFKKKVRRNLKLFKSFHSKRIN